MSAGAEPKAEDPLDRPTLGELMDKRGQEKEDPPARLGKLRDVHVGSHVLYRGARPKVCKLAKVLALVEDGVHAQRFRPLVDRRLRVKWFAMHQGPNGTEIPSEGGPPCTVLIPVKDLLGAVEVHDGLVDEQLDIILVEDGYRLALE